MFHQVMRKLTLSIMILGKQLIVPNFLAILGDMNAKINCPRMKFAYNKRTNGNKLLGLVSENSLCIVNGTFQKRLGKMWTYEGPKVDRHMIDYIRVNSKWKNSIMNAEPYSSFAAVH